MVKGWFSGVFFFSFLVFVISQFICYHDKTWIFPTFLHLQYTTNHTLIYNFLIDVHDSCDFQTVFCPNSGYVINCVVPSTSEKLAYSVLSWWRSWGFNPYIVAFISLRLVVLQPRKGASQIILLTYYLIALILPQQVRESTFEDLRCGRSLDVFVWEERLFLQNGSLYI